MVRFIPNSVSSKVALTALKISKHSPHILFGAGIIGVAASGVLAARATLKVEEILDYHETWSGHINESFEIVDDYTVDDRRKDLALLYVQTTVKITKLYGPAIIVGGLAFAALTGSHRILTKRNAALTAAYAVIDKSFKEYRERVVDDQGVDKDREYLKGIVTEKVSETSEDGKSVTVSEKKTQTGLSPYGVFFHDGNPNWTSRPEMNLLFLRGHQTYLNDLFKSKGYLFLSDVYDALGFEQTKASRIVGWHKDSKNGDNAIDFGIFEDSQALRVWEYATGHEGEIHLDFNVDGPIYDLL
jgi:hypothetical protein